MANLEGHGEVSGLQKFEVGLKKLLLAGTTRHWAQGEVGDCACKVCFSAFFGGVVS